MAELIAAIYIGRGTIYVYVFWREEQEITLWFLNSDYAIICMCERIQIYWIKGFACNL